MYNFFQLSIKFIRYSFTATNGKGHGVHSPFVYDFVTNVLNDKKKYNCYKTIEAQRKKLLQNENIIEVEDFGAGSSVIKKNSRVVKDIAASSLKPKKFAQLLFRIAHYYKPKNMVELGTSLGITSSYLALANTNSTLISLEGSSNIAAIAKNTFTQLQLNNIELIEGNFDNTLSSTLKKIQTIDLAFIDGNHKKIPTLNYFKQLLQHCNENSILIFDDIHWSSDMEEAWDEIKENEQVTLSIDLFFIGLVFFKKDFKQKQHFVIRY